MKPALKLPDLAAAGAALLCGISQPLGLAPFDYWWLALAGLTGLVALMARSALHYFWLTFAYGLGLFGAGVYWVFISIHTFGNASTALALAMTSLFVAFLALLFALPFGLWQRWLGRAWLLLAFAPLWALNEIYRGWIFTGFPWLLSGYAHLDTPLAGFAPVLGVFGISLLVAASAVALYLILTGRRRWPALAALLLVWGGGQLLRPLEWTQPEGPARQVAMVQPNIPQQHKWDRDWLLPTYDRLVQQSQDLWDAHWLIWPEAALPTLLSDAQPFMDAMAHKARATDTSLVTGVIADQDFRFYNSLVVLGLGRGIYHKQRLVPFGEYVPFQDQLRGLIEFFDLPMSVLHRGPPDQAPLWLADTPVWPAVCYEIVYPDLIASQVHQAHAILTVSNDAWFGRSTAPAQHLQMARMRALETRRPLMRATNNGISALVDHQGRILVQGNQDALESLRGEIQPRSGLTPFIATGSWPVALFCLLLLAWPSYRLFTHRRAGRSA